MALSYFERLQEAYPQSVVVAIAQDSAEDLAAFLATSPVGVTVVADGDGSASQMLGVETVPTYWLVDSGGKILESGVAWDRRRLEAIGSALAQIAGIDEVELIGQGENVPSFKPG